MTAVRGDATARRTPGRSCSAAVGGDEGGRGHAGQAGRVVAEQDHGLAQEVHLDRRPAVAAAREPGDGDLFLPPSGNQLPREAVEQGQGGNGAGALGDLGTARLS